MESNLSSAWPFFIAGIFSLCAFASWRAWQHIRRYKFTETRALEYIADKLTDPKKFTVLYADGLARHQRRSGRADFDNAPKFVTAMEGRIKDPKLRRRIVDLVEGIAGANGHEDRASPRPEPLGAALS